MDTFSLTPDEFTDKLKTAYREQFDTFAWEQYCFRYALPPLRRHFGNDAVSRQYQHLIGCIVDATKTFVLQHPGQFHHDLCDANINARHATMNYLYWHQADPATREKALEHVCIQPWDEDEDFDPPFAFIDMRYFQLGADTTPVLNLLYEARWQRLPDRKDRVSPIAALKAVTDAVIALDDLALLDGEPETLFTATQQALSEATLRKQQKGARTLAGAIEKITLTTLLKRIRHHGREGGYRTIEKQFKKGTTLPVAKLSTVLMDLYLTEPLCKSINQLPLRKQSPALSRSIIMLYRYLIREAERGVLPQERYRSLLVHLNHRFYIDQEALVKAMSLHFHTLLCNLPDTVLIESPLRQRINHAVPGNAQWLYFCTAESLRFYRQFNYMTPDEAPLQLFIAGKNKGVTVARLRALLKHLFCMLRNGNSRRIHDQSVACQQLKLFFERWDPHPQYQATLNMIISLLTSELGGQLHDAGADCFSRWTALALIAERADALQGKKLKNLRECIAHAKSDPAATAHLKNLLMSPHWRDYREHACAVLTLTKTHGIQRAAIEHLTSLQHTPSDSPYTHSPLIPVNLNCGALTVTILPYNDPRGILGASVNNVCIPFGGTVHRSHYQPTCRNLIVCSEDTLYLWGLLVEVQDEGLLHPTFILNNLQGALPSRHAHQLTALRQTILSALRQTGEVYTRPFSFNSLCLVDTDTMPIADRAFLLPKLRLDIETKDTVDPRFMKTVQREQPLFNVSVSP